MTAPADGPSLGELGRIITQMRDDNREAFGRIDNRLQELITREVHDLATKALSDRIDQVREANDDLEKKQEKFEEQQAANRRLILTVLVAPIVMMLIQLYVTAQIGVKG